MYDYGVERNVVSVVVRCRRDAGWLRCRVERGRCCGFGVDVAVDRRWRLLECLPIRLLAVMGGAWMCVGVVEWDPVSAVDSVWVWCECGVEWEGRGRGFGVDATVGQRWRLLE
ncbi:hypothetical protein AB0J72_09095 [Dactylosporangium sp. NPDC049742]|uniref:hypothetical protein n=1 Tax=Dactylosporangium sp. NPDC049742 TaxID=3154737 RepID=UPI003447797B